jgi:hypothetical protein
LTALTGCKTLYAMAASDGNGWQKRMESAPGVTALQGALPGNGKAALRVSEWAACLVAGG